VRVVGNEPVVGAQLGDPGDGGDLEIMLVDGCQSAQYCVWTGGGYHEMVRTEFLMWAGYPGNTWDSEDNADQIEDYAAASRLHGVGDDWLDHMYDESLFGPSCPTVIIGGSSDTNIDNMYDNGVAACSRRGAHRPRQDDRCQRRPGPRAARRRSRTPDGARVRRRRVRCCHDEEFASQMRDEETGALAGPVVLGTKTYVPRTLSGVPALGDRAVVTRDTAGTVTRITAGWATLDPVTVVEVSDTENIDLDEAARFSARPVVATRTVVILDRAVDGLVSGARLCTEVTELRTGVDGATVPAALYVMDGATFDPRASEGI
jgi:hypothetical protein